MSIPWQPLEQGQVNPDLTAAMRGIGQDESNFTVSVWQNNLYQVVARAHGTGIVHLSVKRHDRRQIRNWRHLQQIKNEVCGEEREAMEIYPAESRLVDGANEYHLWVLPEGMRITDQIGFREGIVPTDEQIERFNAAGHKGRQEPWDEGLTTGRNENTPYMTAEQEATIAANIPTKPKAGDFGWCECGAPLDADGKCIRQPPCWARKDS